MSWYFSNLILSWKLTCLGWGWIVANSTWLLTIFHAILFFVSQVLLRRSKKRLQKEKAELTIINKQLTGRLNYYIRNHGTK